MNSKSQIDLMSMFQQDQESVLNGIQKFAKDIFGGNDEEAKKKLCKNLHEITKICHCSNKVKNTKNQTLMAEKRSKKFENELQIAKKKKLECSKLPNELWLIIMNYVNTKDLFTNMALACKNFNCLTKEVKYLELKDISEQEFGSAINLLKTATHLKEISIATKILKPESKKMLMKLLIQALVSSKNIKSIKLQPFYGSSNPKYEISSSYELGGFKEIKTLGANLEHLHLRNVIFTTKSVISQIAQIPTLKSLKLSLPINEKLGESFTPDNILEFSNRSNLEAISF